MISLMTTCPTGEAFVAAYTTLTLLLSPEMNWLFRSTPVTLNRFVPFCSGTETIQAVRLVHVSGYAAPLIQTEATFTGAVPVTYARLLLTVTLELTEKLPAFTAAS